MMRVLRLWSQTLLPSAITTLLYFVIFGKLIGSRIGSMNGISYIDYIAPGLIMMTIINNTYASASMFYMTKFTRAIEEILVSPTPLWVVLWGYVGGWVSRGLMAGLIVYGIALFFGGIYFHHLIVLFLIALLSATLFGLAGFLNGQLAKSFDGISFMPTFVLTPLTYLGGVFYSINLLPVFWLHASMLNPILYMVNGFRYGFLGVSDINIGFAFGLLILCNVLLYGVWF